MSRYPVEPTDHWPEPS